MTIENSGASGTDLPTLNGVADRNNPKRDVYLRQFAEQYRSLLVEYLRARGSLSEAEASDTVHSFLQTKILTDEAKVNLVVKYLEFRQEDSEKKAVKFRYYLKSSLWNYFLDLKRLQNRLPTTSISGLSGFDVGSNDDAILFDKVWLNGLLRKVIIDVRDECHKKKQLDKWELFLRQIVLPRLLNVSTPGYAELSSDLGFKTPRSASFAVRTVIRKFQSHLRTAIADYLPEDSILGAESCVDEEYNDIMSLLTEPRVVEIDMLSELIGDLELSKRNSLMSDVPDNVVAGERTFLFDPEMTMYATGRDFEYRWGQLRETRISDWLTSWDTPLENSEDLTLEDLACGAKMSDKLIEAVRNTAKRAAREPDDEPIAILGLIYLLAIAVGFKHHQRIFSSEKVPKIRARMNQLVSVPWLDENSKQTLKFFLDAEIVE